VSDDLLAGIAALDGFTPARCEAYVRRFGLDVVLPVGFDPAVTAGWVACRLAGIPDGDEDTGFEFFSRRQPDGSWQLGFSTDNARSRALVWAIGAFLVGLGARVEDPQEEYVFGLADLGELENRVRALVAGAAQESVDPSLRILTDTLDHVLGGSGFVADGPPHSARRRLWYEDGGWYLAAMDFAAWPGLGSGATLNVFATMLWRPPLDESDPVRLVMDVGGDAYDSKVTARARYFDDDAAYAAACQAMAHGGLEVAVKMRALRDWAGAKRILLNRGFVGGDVWGNWNRAMLCFLTGDPRGWDYAERFRRACAEQCGDGQGWLDEFMRRNPAVLAGFGGDGAAARAWVVDVINANRARLRATGMAGIAATPFDAPPVGTVPVEPLEPVRRQRWSLVPRREPRWPVDEER